MAEGMTHGAIIVNCTSPRHPPTAGFMHQESLRHSKDVVRIA